MIIVGFFFPQLLLHLDLGFWKEKYFLPSFFFTCVQWQDYNYAFFFRRISIFFGFKMLLMNFKLKANKIYLLFLSR